MFQVMRDQVSDEIGFKGYDPSDDMLGRFSPLDGTVEFYGRICAAVEPHFVVLDLGVGRGAWYFEDQCQYHRRLRDIRGKVSEYIGADIDRAVLSNPTTSRNVLLERHTIPLDRESVDLILCDYVLEHIIDVQRFRDEVARVLKQGGLFCARTPHALNYVSLAARMIKNVKHARPLRLAQPNRKSEDVFPTAYRCNTLSSVSRIFAGWKNYSYLYVAEPQYYFGSKLAYHAFALIHKFAPKALVGNLFVFLRKPSADGFAIGGEL